MAALPAGDNPRGIPRAIFIESVEQFLEETGDNPDESLKKLQETLAKYRFMESTSSTRRQGLEEKVPELRRTLDMLRVLERRAPSESPLEAHFELSDTMWVTSELSQADEVYIWLGASTMLSYPRQRAIDLLQTKLGTAEHSLRNVHDDLTFLREQITTSEVNIARLYNWDVKSRRGGPDK